MDLLLWSLCFSICISSSFPCTSKEVLYKMQHAPLTCILSPPLYATLSNTKTCHVQGIALHSLSSPVLLTCQSSNGARLLLYPNLTTSPFISGYEHESFLPPSGNHPSSIQMNRQNQVAIAIAQGYNKGPTRIDFYEIIAKEKLGMKISDSSVEHPEGHLGAVAYATFITTTWMIGCGWNCETVAIWTKPKSILYETNNTTWTRQYYGKTVDLLITNSSIDTKVGSYNALYLSQDCSSNTSLILYATHGWWMDVYRINTTTFQWTKLWKRSFGWRPSVNSLKPLFLEGVSLLFPPKNDSTISLPTIVTAPHDYGPCGTSTTCTRGVHICSFSKVPESNILNYEKNNVI